MFTIGNRIVVTTLLGLDLVSHDVLSSSSSRSPRSPVPVAILRSLSGGDLNQTQTENQPVNCVTHTQSNQAQGSKISKGQKENFDNRSPQPVRRMHTTPGPGSGSGAGFRIKFCDHWLSQTSSSSSSSTKPSNSKTSSLSPRKVRDGSPTQGPNQIIQSPKIHKNQDHEGTQNVSRANTTISTRLRSSIKSDPGLSSRRTLPAKLNRSVTIDSTPTLITLNHSNSAEERVKSLGSSVSVPVAGSRKTVGTSSSKERNGTGTQTQRSRSVEHVRPSTMATVSSKGSSPTTATPKSSRGSLNTNSTIRRQKTTGGHESSYLNNALRTPVLNSRKDDVTPRFAFKQNCTNQTQTQSHNVQRMATCPTSTGSNLANNSISRPANPNLLNTNTNSVPVTVNTTSSGSTSRFSFTPEDTTLTVKKTINILDWDEAIFPTKYMSEIYNRFWYAVIKVINGIIDNNVNVDTDVIDNSGFDIVEKFMSTVHNQMAKKYAFEEYCNSEMLDCENDWNKRDFERIWQSHDDIQSRWVKYVDFILKDWKSAIHVTYKTIKKIMKDDSNAKTVIVSNGSWNGYILKFLQTHVFLELIFPDTLNNNITAAAGSARSSTPPRKNKSQDLLALTRNSLLQKTIKGLRNELVSIREVAQTNHQQLYLDEYIDRMLKNIFDDNYHYDTLTSMYLKEKLNNVPLYRTLMHDLPVVTFVDVADIWTTMTQLEKKNPMKYKEFFDFLNSTGSSINLDGNMSEFYSMTQVHVPLNSIAIYKKILMELSIFDIQLKAIRANSSSGIRSNTDSDLVSDHYTKTIEILNFTDISERRSALGKNQSAVKQCFTEIAVKELLSIMLDEDTDFKEAIDLDIQSPHSYYRATQNDIEAKNSVLSLTDIKNYDKVQMILNLNSIGDNAIDSEGLALAKLKLISVWPWNRNSSNSKGTKGKNKFQNMKLNKTFYHVPRDYKDGELILHWKNILKVYGNVGLNEIPIEFSMNIKDSMSRLKEWIVSEKLLKVRGQKQLQCFSDEDHNLSKEGKFYRSTNDIKTTKDKDSATQIDRFLKIVMLVLIQIASTYDVKNDKSLSWRDEYKMLYHWYIHGTESEFDCSIGNQENLNKILHEILCVTSESFDALVVKMNTMTLDMIQAEARQTMTSPQSSPSALLSGFRSVRGQNPSQTDDVGMVYKDMGLISTGCLLSDVTNISLK